MKKSEVMKHVPGTAEYVVLHARWQRSRGRRPSAAFSWQTDPRKALTAAMRMAYFPESGAYLGGGMPENYKCAQCGATGCKLWREYHTVSPQLLCARCAAADQREDVSDIDAYGRRSFHGGRIDQIGWYVPAVPTEEGGGYWGYTSVPQPGCNWWRKLPTLPLQN